MHSRWSSLLGLLALAACHRRARPPSPSPAVAVATAAENSVEDVAPASDDLVPGPLNAFGLQLPTVTQARLATPDMKVFRIDAPMARVMRYLEQRLEVHAADIHPLAAMIHRAEVRGARANLVVDVGVRDEGDRTMVTVFNRTPPPESPSRPPTAEEGLRAVGVDPSTGQYAPEFNR